MTVRTATPIARRLLLGASLGSLTLALALAPATPASAQTLGASLGAQISRPRPPAQPTGATPQRSGTMAAALQRQQTTEARVAQIRAYATQIRGAAIDRGQVANGLDPNGLDPTKGIRDALAATRAGDTARANQLLISAGAGNDATGLATWHGAGLPTQATGADGRVTVTIDQTAERALLSWNRFDIGSNTTLQFNQKSGGVAQRGWVAVNRVTNATDPSRILGNLKADGTVVVLNQSGIIFGATSQVNTSSLLASSLELGNAAESFVDESFSRRLRPIDVRARNAAFLTGGLFGPSNNSLFISDRNNPAVLVSGSLEQNGNQVRYAATAEGKVVVDPGARLTSGTGGFIVLAAPTIESGGILSATEGQVSLQAGRTIGFVRSSGSASDDPNVRGFRFNSFSYDSSPNGPVGPAAPLGGTITVGGLIESRRGYLSLGTGLLGEVQLNGLLSATTSVSRNGKISLTAGTVRIGGSADPARAGAIEILPDGNGETLPQGSANSPSTFKPSVIEIGAQVRSTATPFGLVPGEFDMGRNAVIRAPGATLNVGAVSLDPSDASAFAILPSSITVGADAIIDVSGLRDIQLDPSRVFVEIRPVKRNELRDTPNYREVAVDGNFTLNGATLIVDTRLTGVRDDGVAWIGSPLIEAGSIASQIGLSAAEFMTLGGRVTLNSSQPSSFQGPPESFNRISIGRGAVVDFSGGWVNYAAGPVRSSQLVADDGRIVDLARANPNDVYVDVVSGETQVLQPRIGVLSTAFNGTGRGSRYQSAYDEGRDAGSLTINAPVVTSDGTFFGNAFAGSRQIAASATASGTRANRPAQANGGELPVGGALGIAGLTDMVIYRGRRSAADADPIELLLDGDMLSNAGLGGLALSTSATVTFAGADFVGLQAPGALAITGASALRLAPGGSLSVLAGRTIRFEGTVEAPSGTITAETIGSNPPAPGSNPSTAPFFSATGSVLRQGLYGEGNGDDVITTYASADRVPGEGLFDILVNGRVSTAGLWTNDFRAGDLTGGSAFTDAGSISLTVAPRVFLGVGPFSAETQAVDRSGSIRVRGVLDVSSGGHVQRDGKLVLTARGGDVTLRNDTVYASVGLTFSGLISDPSSAFSNLPINGTNQSVDFTTVPARSFADRPVVAALVPEPRSTVEIAEGSIRGFGFGGGGTFTLSAPDISFGSTRRAGSTHIGLDFFRTTGFGALDVTTMRSRIVPDIFTNASKGDSAFLETTRFIIDRGERLDLTQWVRPSILTVDQRAAIVGVESGTDLSTVDLLAPIRPDLIWNQQGASITLRGLSELNVLAGGEIVGAPGAAVTASKIYQAGRVSLPGGTLAQVSNLPVALETAGLGVRDPSLGGRGLADAFGGPVDAQGRFGETAINAAGVTTPATFGVPGRLLTNQELVTLEGSDRLIHFLGLLDQDQGVVLAQGSTTDLSGIALYDPLAPLQNGVRARVGRVLDGGSISTARGRLISRQTSLSTSQQTITGQRFTREDGATVDIGGAAGSYDLTGALGVPTPIVQWSAAGSLSVQGGGTLGTTPIDALGGAPQAQGGTLDWLNPTIGDQTSGLAQDYLPASLITASGFDTVIARGNLRLDGDFTLSLRKSLQILSPASLGNASDLTTAATYLSATTGTDATISAGYVRIDNRVSTSRADGAEGDAQVRLRAGRQGIDLVGGVGFDRTIDTMILQTPGDIRLSGVREVVFSALPSFNGSIMSGGDLVLDARRTYATTGTGNLQTMLEGVAGLGSAPYVIGSTGTITFGNSFLDPAAPPPLSAGTYLRVQAPRIVQNGYLAAPLGTIELGTAQTESIVFGAGSVTSVSAAGLTIPYGTTTDLIEYFFPTVGTPLTQLPTGRLVMTGRSIAQDAGARIDGRGGGDVFAYEFQSGVGGSRDVLDRFNRDVFSSNGYDPATGTGYQYADRRQVFALVPVDAAGGIANYDPVYSADYGIDGPVDLYGADAGKTVRLEGGQGVAAGEYLLLPAKYAMTIPGALRLVENTDAAAPPPGASTRLLDGSIVMAGTFGFAGTGIAESQRRSFTVQTRDTFLDYSRIVTTGGTKAITDAAGQAGRPRPRTPLDAASVVLAPLNELRLAGVFDTRPATGGFGGQLDVIASAIVIAADDRVTVPTGTLRLTDDTLSVLSGSSLLIGGQRSTAADGTTAIAVAARSIDILDGVSLAAPELLFAVGGSDSRLTIADGVSLAGTAVSEAQPTTDFTINTNATAPNFDRTGTGSLLRLSGGTERLVSRTAGSTGASAIEIGTVSISGSALTLDTTRSLTVADDARLNVRSIAMSGVPFQFGVDAADTPGAIGTGLTARLGMAERLTVRSPGQLTFAAGSYRFNDLILDTPAIALVPGAVAGSVAITASDVRFLNSRAGATGCTALLCGAGSRFALTAETVSFGANAVSIAGFADGVSLAGTGGMFVEGKGSLSTGASGLSLRAPFLVERAVLPDPRQQPVRPNYDFLTAGAFILDGTGLTASPAGNLAPGARIGIGSINAPVLSASITGSLIRATAGIVDIQSQGNVGLVSASIATPGFSATFGDAADRVTVSAGGGVVRLVSRGGNVAADAASSLVTDTGVGNAGAVHLLAGRGTVTLGAALNPNVTGNRTGSLTIDSGRGGFALNEFAVRAGRLFGGDIAIRIGQGDLTLAADASLRARSVTLTADGGAIDIAGRIDTSGAHVAGLSADDARNAAVNGGDIALWGNAGVRLGATALLDTHTSGYADTDTRPAEAGDVTIGIGNAGAAISIANGAVIDVGARRTQAALTAGETGARLVAQTVSEGAGAGTVYRFVDADRGGIVTLRAPVIGAGGNQVAVSQNGRIVGAGGVELEAFRRYDLDALAATGLYTGIVSANGTVTLDMAADAARNPFTGDFTLADGTPSLVRFIQGFNVSAADGSSLGGMRLRPGVELVSTGNLSTASQWNLAAATFSPAQLQAAVDAGDLRLIPEISTPGAPRYAVVPGREGDLLNRFATFLYRVGGTARGEAPVVTMRAGGDLTVNRSISDGFFTFRDRSDPAWLNYQLGGGDRVYSPALSFSCGGTSGSCASVPSFLTTPGTPPTSQIIVIGLNTAAQQGQLNSGAAFVNSPLAVAGNGAAGLVAANGTPIGDTLGFGELFPLLAGDTAMRSSDIRLVGGAGPDLSANPLRVDLASGGDVTVGGEFSYRLAATGTVAFNGALQFQLQRSGSSGEDPVPFDVDDTFNLTSPVAGLDSISEDAFTTINWGTSTSGLGADARAAARAYFAGRNARFVGSANAPSGVSARLADIVGFVQSFERTYQAGLASGRTGYTANRTPPIVNFGTNNLAYVRTTVRSGDGAIAVRAAGDVDLRGSENPVFRTSTGQAVNQPNYTAQTIVAQVGGSAIYTAGLRVAAADIRARIVGGDLVTLRPDSPYLIPKAEQVDFVPSTQGFSDASPVLAKGGGDLSIEAGRDVLSRRDLWNDFNLRTARTYSLNGPQETTRPTLSIGAESQLWRVGSIGVDTEIGAAYRYFASGVGALAGGDLDIVAGRDVADLTIAATNTVTSLTGDRRVMLTFGEGDLALTAGRDIAGGQYDIAAGTGRISAERDIVAFGTEPVIDAAHNLRVRLSDAVVDVSARGAATLSTVSALGVGVRPSDPNQVGFYSPSAAFRLTANESAVLTERDYLSVGKTPGFVGFNPTSPPAFFIQVLPPSFGMTSLSGQTVLSPGLRHLLYPSPIGQLNLFSQGDIDDLVVTMSDADPYLLGGAFSPPALSQTPFQLPVVSATTGDDELRLFHNQRITHLGDPLPARIFSNGDIDTSAITLAKQGRITAGGDIIDMYFSGQNVAEGDITRIRAGGDIRGTIGGVLRPYVRSGLFELGGPGEFIVEAGRNIGPLVTSANVRSLQFNRVDSYAGGIRTIGNNVNPWLSATGAELSVRFGMKEGAAFDALRETYLNPANAAMLDGDLFVQLTDIFGNSSPDRARPIYAPILARWLRDKAPAAFAALFPGQGFADTAAGNAALADAAYGRMGDLYAAFARIDPLRQQSFLTSELYFNELAQAGRPDSPSYLQYIRGYRAVQTLFPTERGYTDNLALFTTDPATISADHPLGVPTRNLANGEPQPAQRIVTGNVDLRLSTIQTARGGDLTILGPGGDIVAGSVVRTSEQASRRNTALAPVRGVGEAGIIVYEQPPLQGGDLSGVISQDGGFQIDSVPLGYEGVLTLDGGRVNAFTDGNFVLNQSRVFTQAGGNITLWSSNGDLNAGQGPRTGSSFPPITVRIDTNGVSSVDTAGSVSGAGIGSFRRRPDDPAADIVLIAPVGEVDAGDAGVRSSGSIFVAAARVANADNFQAAGNITGVPTTAATLAIATPTQANSAIAAQAAQAAQAGRQTDRRSVITVDFLGPVNDGTCDPNRPNDPDCN